MKTKILFSIAGLLILSACQTVPYQGVAREVKRKPQAGGVLALPMNPRAEDRTKAETVMRGNCSAAGFKVLEEGEIVIGQTTKSDSRLENRENSEHQMGSIFGMAVMGGEKGGTDTSTSTKTEAIKEWQLVYECEKAVKSAKSASQR